MALPPWPHLGKPIKIIAIIVIFCFLYATFFHTKTIQLLQMQQPTTSHTGAEQLYQEVRILCMVITAPAFHDKRAVHILRTWGRHCNRLLFISTEEHAELEPIVVNVKETKNEVWMKIQRGLSLAYEHHAHEADWFLKVEDDTFVVLENLRHFLRPYSSATPIYFGSKSMPFDHIATNAGYVLSKEAVRRFLTSKIFPILDHNANGEQVEMEHWLQKVGVSAGNSNLQDGDTFFSYPAYIPKKKTIMEENANNSAPWWSLEKGIRRPSRHAITFHNVNAQVMYTLEYLIHNMRLFGKTTRK